jgi:ribonucleoside-diphosphate reductase alpha chain
VNLFLPADVHKKELHHLHYLAWKKGLKSLYYCRSKSLQRAYKISSLYENNKDLKDECLACQ